MRTILDLFCGDGGSAAGYKQAGFYVIGVDIEDHPEYCGDEFYQADAMEFDLTGIDFVNASPPCQADCTLTAGTNQRMAGKYQSLTDAIRDRLDDADVPYVLENPPVVQPCAKTLPCAESDSECE